MPPRLARVDIAASELLIQTHVLEADIRASAGESSLIQTWAEDPTVTTEVFEVI